MNKNNVFLTVGVLLLLLLSVSVEPCSAGAIDSICQVPSPEAACLTRYKLYSSDLNTGTANISVPLYTIKDADFELPIYLKYDASGVHVCQDAGFAGQNWNLMCTGMVMRQVMGTPDDTAPGTPMPNNLDSREYGLLSLLRSGFSLSRQQMDSIGGIMTPLYNSGASLIRLQNQAGNYFYTTNYNPDIYTVLLPNGDSFQFTIGEDANPVVIGRRGCLVDISNMPIQIHNDTTHTSVISVTTEDGYVYSFGGNASKLEISYSGETPCGGSFVNCANTQSKVINGWYLTKITAPSGENVTFNYQNQLNEHNSLYVEEDPCNNNADPSTGYNSDTPYLKKFIFYTQSSKSENYDVTGNLPGCSYVGSSNFLLSLRFTKIPVLTSISTSTLNITFHYSESTHNFYGIIQSPGHHTIPEQLSSFNRATYQIDSVIVSAKGNTAKRKIRFVYENMNGRKIRLHNNTLQSQRRFLKNLYVNDRPYSFEYYDVSYLAHPLDTHMDLEGFSNQYAFGDDAQAAPQILIPTEIDYNNSDSVNRYIFSELRKTNPDMANTGMLKKITYPTGGYSIFEYEAHDYAKRAYRNTQAVKEKIVSGHDYAGGARIKKIKNSTGEYTEYDYVDDNGNCSGIYNSVGAFGYSYNYPRGDRYYWGHYLQSSSISAISTIREPTVTYSQVTETKRGVNTGGLNSCTYYFSNRDSIRDELTDGANIFNCDTASINKFLNSLYMYSSNARDRGLLLRKEYYGPTGLIKDETFVYNTKESQMSKVVMGVGTNHGNPPHVDNANSYYIYTHDNSLVKKITTEWDGNKSVTQECTYHRGAVNNSRPHNMVTIKTITAPDSTIVRTTYTHPIDYTINSSVSHPFANTLREMTNRNMISNIVEESVYKGKDNILSLTQSTLNHYVYNTDECQYPILRGIYKTAITEPVRPYSPYNPHTTLATFLSGDTPFYKELSFDLYNYKGRLLQVTDKNGLKKSFIWGYAQQKIIATVIGGEYSSFSNNWGGSNGINGINVMYNYGLSLTPSESYYNAINSLRNSYHVTSYKYNLLYGVTSITDPLGVTTLYDYYPTGELKNKYQLDSNGGKEVLNAYQYNYQQPAN